MPAFLINRRFHGSLSADTATILQKMYDFLGFSPFIPRDILKNINVFLDDSQHREVTITLAELKHELMSLLRLYKNLEKMEISPNELENITAKIGELQRLVDDCEKKGEKAIKVSVSLLGYYKRNRELGKPEIVLMMDELKDDCLLTGIVFVHELMHAYYDLHSSEHIQCPELEEPLAEYGMLCFVEMFQRAYPCYPKLLEYAMSHVEKKKHSIGVCHYGFGHYLFTDRRNYCVEWAMLYHNKCLDIKKNNADLKKFVSMLSAVKYPCSERSCEELLYKVLNPIKFWFEIESHEYAKCLIFEPLRTSCNRMAFNREYMVCTPIRITFIPKKNPAFSGDASIILPSSANSCSRFNIRKTLWTKFVSVYGKNARVKFAFYQKSHGEWIAKEV